MSTRSDLPSVVTRFIRREGLLQPNEPVWVAVSGGVDSMVLLHVLRALGHRCSVAHVDHGLRGEESDGDRVFVEDYCGKEGITFRSTRVGVKAHAAAQGLSTQLAARDLRYAWFAELGKEQPMPMALGHHADDAVESLFINLLRGTGSQGWSAIRPVSGVFVRPLLSVSREEILKYAADQGVPFREDSSNTDPRYLRNRIRHELIPQLEAMRPGALRTMARSLDLLRELEEAGRRHGLAALADVVPAQDGNIHLPFQRIANSGTPNLLLYQLLRPMGFHPDVFDRIRDAIADRATGRVFTAGAWQVVVDRDELIIGLALTDHPAYVIDPDMPTLDTGPFRWTLSESSEDLVPASMSDILLDAERLSFPLELRPWREGDRMRPIGLGGSKLISDILIDAKVPMSEKAGVYVLVSGEEVVWLVGHRLAEGFQAGNSTTSVLRIVRSR